MLNKLVTKIFMVGAALVIGLQVSASAESQRGIYTKENFFPGKQLWEFGGRLSFIETNDNLEQLRDSSTDSVLVTPYLRYGIKDHFSLDVDLPFGSADSDALGDDSGLGNIGIGLQLLAFEDVFEFPYIIPHAKVILETADEDSALDDGSGGFEFGVSLGTVVDDRFHWIGDASYEIRGDEENLLRGSVTFIADISADFSLIAEGTITDEGDSAGTDNPITAIGGMAYDWNDNFQTSWYGGGGLNTDDDVIAMFKASYAF